MTFQDFIITPIFFLLLLFAAYMIRPFVTNRNTKPYFISGLLVKFIGAIALGLIYQFYYSGGDTFTYHTHGSRWIWQAVMDNPLQGLQLFFSDAGNYNNNLYQYTSHIWFYRDHASYFIVKIAAFFDLFTFSTYSATALLFATLSFSGHWALYSAFEKIYPSQKKNLAIAILFVPSVVFWGSGILKDTITLAALCWMTYSMFNIVIWRKNIIISTLLLLFFAWTIYSIKIYILLSFLVAASFYLYVHFSSRIKNTIIKIIVMPFFITLFLGGGYYVIDLVSEGDSRYALDKIGQTAMITAYDIRYGWGARNGENSGYTLGELDGGISSLIALAPQGIIVTLFRPWLWEVKNPLMLLASLESFIILCLTIYTLWKVKWNKLRKAITNPLLLYCLSFSLLFAFAVGVSTYNFGTLMRYKIPVMPFYLIFLFTLNNKNNEATN